MTLSQPWQDFLTAARGGTPERVPVALIVDSPWMPGFARMHTLDFFLDTDAWLDTYLKVMARFPDVVFLPGFWVEYGMANEPSAFGAGMVWRADSPPSLRHLELPPAEWGRLKLPDPETDGLMPLVLRRLERLEKGGGLPEPHRIHFVAARGPLAIAAHVLGTTPFLEATASEPEATAAALEIFTDTVIGFLKAQLARLRDPLGILVLDDLPGMLSPRAFDRMALPYLQRIFDAFPGLVRIYHNDTPCAHLLPRIGQLHCEVWNFSHETDIAAVRAAAPRMALLGNVAPLGTLVRGTADQVYEEARACVDKVAAGAAPSCSPPAAASRRALPRRTSTRWSGRPGPEGGRPSVGPCGGRARGSPRGGAEGTLRRGRAPRHPSRASRGRRLPGRRRPRGTTRSPPASSPSSGRSRLRGTARSEGRARAAGSRGSRRGRSSSRAARPPKGSRGGARRRPRSPGCPGRGRSC